jgi:choline-sulfatase
VRRFLILLAFLIAGVAVAKPLDVREIWQPLPHPSLPLRSPVLTGLEPPAQSPPDGSASIVLITVDTWRADRLSLYGSNRPTSPFLDALADDAVVFDRASAPTSWTWPTMVSLSSGVHPRSHGAVKPETAMCDEADTLAEVLYRGGWRTGFSGVNTYFEPPEAGYRQGFEYFWAGGLAIADTVLEYDGYFLDGVGPEPFFLHTHLFDPHCPYDPEESVLAEIRAVPQGHRGSTPSGVIHLSDMEVGTCHYVPPVPSHVHEQDIKAYTPSLDLQDYLDYYDGELLETDRAMARLKERMDKDGLWDTSWVVITGDHGEEFGEHDLIGHGRDLHAETTWVPLIIKPPKGVAFVPGHRDLPVSLVDVPSTIVAALGQPAPASWQGRDLLPVIRGETMPPKPVITETLYEDRRWGATVEWDGMRLIVYRDGPNVAKIYRANDRMEDVDGFKGDDPYLTLRAAGLAGLLRAELQSLSARSLCDVGTMELDPTHWEALRKLGYVAGPEVEPPLEHVEPPAEAPEPPQDPESQLPEEPDPDKRTED